MEVIIKRQKRRKRRLIRLFFRLTLICLVVLAACAVGLLSYTKMQGPPPLTVAQTTVYFGADQSIIGERHQGENRLWLELSAIDEDVINATIAVEDRKFYQHFGFDPIRIGGALIANIRSGSMAQGASTITQQYARNLYLSHDKTWKRKWNELIYSLRLEMNYDKDQILEGYLNTVYYGHGAYGIEAASYHYFGKSAQDLSLGEASMLAGIPKGPSYYSPLFNYERAKKRQSVVLQSMVTTGMLTQVEADQAYAEELTFTHDELEATTTIGPYFQDAVERELIQEIGLEPTLFEIGGLRIYTTLDPDMQLEAERLIQEEMPENDLQVALVAIDPQQGDVKALIGGKNYADSPYNRATDLRRHGGSTFKPFLYYAALENGYTPASTLLSEETSFTLDEGREVWKPSNFNDHYANDFITLLQAMAYSDNIYAIKTHLLLGMDKLVDVADRTGVRSPLPERASLALGASEVNPLELSAAYSAFANGGQRVTPRLVRKVVDSEGQVLYESEPELEQTLDPRLAYITTDLMKGMFDPYLNGYTSVTGGSISHLLSREVAGKSGSTPTDSWMIGFTPQLSTSVWVGYDRDHLLNPAEGQIAKRIWAQFTENALSEQEPASFAVPDGVVAVEMDPFTGMLATEDCPTHRVTYFLEGTEPTEPCPSNAEEDSSPHEEQDHERENLIDRFFRWFGH